MTVRDPLIGQTIDRRYRIDTLLGQGGMCSVYHAEDTRKTRVVAIKILPAERAARPEMATRFKREITTGKRIQHPNVIAILDSGSLPDGALYYVMELLKGRSLETVLKGGRITVTRALSIARQILAGLDVAHDLGITHRDVKPDNVFLVDEGGVERVKLLDFGIAANDRAAVKLTAAGVAFGTPEYISPEMAMGLPVDSRADLYSLGVVLFEMLAGRLPFDQRMPKELLRAHVQDRPPRLADAAPDLVVDSRVEALVARALVKQPDDRWPTAAAMIAAIDAVSRGKSRALLWAALAALGLLSLGGLVWWLSRGSPPPPTVSAPPAREANRPGVTRRPPPAPEHATKHKPHR